VTGHGGAKLVLPHSTASSTAQRQLVTSREPVAGLKIRNPRRIGAELPANGP
jgi:hypothetical protein